MIIGVKKRISSLVNHLYDEILEEFGIEEGDPVILNLIRWNELFEIAKKEKENDGINKCLFLYLLNLSTNYMKTSDTDYLTEIKQLLLTVNYYEMDSNINDLISICLKIMAYSVKNDQFDKNYKEIKTFLIAKNTYNPQDYSTIESLKNDIFIRINNLKKLNKTSGFKPNETTMSNFNDDQKLISFDSLSKNEKLNLVFIGLKHGKRSFISMNFKKYFKNRSCYDLYKIFDSLQRKQDKFRWFKKQVESMKELKVVNYSKEKENTILSDFGQDELNYTEMNKRNLRNRSFNNKESRKIGKPWTKNETLNLVYLRRKLELDWTTIANDYLINRKGRSVEQKFFSLKSNKIEFDEILKEVELMKELKYINCGEEIKSEPVVIDSTSFSNNESRAYWEKNEILNLCYLRHKLSYDWAVIGREYKKYFNNRSTQSIYKKYSKIIEDKIEFDKILKEVELMEKLKDIDTELVEVVKSEAILNSTRISTKIKSAAWTKNEILNLVYLYNKFGSRWATFANDYKKYFNNRNRRQLDRKYVCLKNNEAKDFNLNEIQREVKLMKGLMNLKSSNSSSVDSRRKQIDWTRTEILNLVYLVKEFGHEWTMFATKYREYFNQRTVWIMRHKYQKLKENSKNYQDLARKARSLVQIKTEVSDKPTVWSHEECLYLVHGVRQYGENWEDILDNFGTHFDRARTENHLKLKYLNLTNDQTQFQFLLKEVKKLLEEI